MRISSILFFRLWKDVTTNLKTQDIEAATDAKHFLEERQRREAKERLAEGRKWNTKVQKTSLKALCNHVFTLQNLSCMVLHAISVFGKV